jgi:hypothetical protein
VTAGARSLIGLGVSAGIGWMTGDGVTTGALGSGVGEGGAGTKAAAGVGGSSGAVKVLPHIGHFAIWPAKWSGMISFR